MRWTEALITAFATYSRIPMPAVPWNDNNKKYALCFFPLVGAAVGASLAAWLWACDLLAIGPVLRGAVAAAIPVWVTGGIHMDGFLDACDALASLGSPEKRLEILKDSRVGAFAMMRGAIYMIIAAGLYAECDLKTALPLGTCFVISRALSARLSVTVRQARPGGMLDGFVETEAGRKVLRASGIYLIFAALVWLLCLGWRALLPALAAALCLIFCRRAMLRCFGGITGDLAGWYLEITEISCVAMIVLGGRL